jgi:hypothetical protein
MKKHTIMNRQNTIKRTCFFLFVFMLFLNAFAQNEQGRDFYVAFANNNSQTSVNDVELRLKIIATVTTEVRLSYTDGSVSDVVFTVPSGTIYEHILSAAEKAASYTSSLGSLGTTYKKTIHVTASAPIVLYASNCATQSAEVTRILPVEDWGTLYYKNSGFGTTNGVIVIAKESNTTITVSGYSFTLQPGEMRAFSVSSGTKIESTDKAFACFENTPSGKIETSTTFQYEQLPPVSTWGTQYVIPSNMYNSSYARIVYNQTTNLTITYTDGSIEQVQVNAAGYKDLTYTQSRLKKACYVVSDKPVGICLYLKTVPSNPALVSLRPAEAWLPPLGHQERNVIIHPFSFNSTYLFRPLEHHVLLIAPTASKTRTTVSLNGAFPQTLNHPMTWIADNVGGSGYSVGRYSMGESNIADVMNTAFQFDNPDGLIVLGYGCGTSGAYFYTAGGSGSTMNSTAGFTVNGINCFDVNGHVFTSGTSLTLNAYPNTLTNITWMLNGKEISGSNNLFTVNVDNLPDGYYTLVMTAFLGTEKKTFSTFFYIGERLSEISSNANSANQGTRFYVAFARNDTVSTVKKNTTEDIKRRNVELILRMTAFEATDVNLSFTQNHLLDTTLHIPAGITDYILPYERARAAYSGNSVHPNIPGSMKRSILVTSLSPITLHAINSVNASVEATMVFPVENWGKEYYNVSMSTYNTTQAAGYIVIADEDNTTVSFSRGNLNGFTDYSRVLNKGEVEYQFLPSVGSMTCLHIEADKPVGYFETNTRARVGVLDNYTFEQMAPVNQWGKRFILPTGITGAIQIRIFAKENTVINMHYSDGSFETMTMQSWHNYFKDITLSGNKNSCYIETSKPVCIAAYNKGDATIFGSALQPGEAWLPPIGQCTRNVLLSPLDINGIHIYQTMRHDVILITPTEGKENTTVSINGEPSQMLNHPMTWVADNIGGSGYSFARYYLGENDPGNPLKTTFRFDNPNGVLVFVYGQGSYANYFYCAGYGGYDLGLSFTINDIPYTEIEGSVQCGSDFEFKATTTLTPFNSDFPKWYINGNEETTVRGQMIWSKTLSPDTYTVLLEMKDDEGVVTTRTVTFTVSTVPTINAISFSSLCAGDQFVLDAPTVNSGSSTVLSNGWEIETGVGTGNYTALTMPYTVNISDNGKNVRYWVMNDCGKGYSNLILTVVNCPTLTGTVFPFVYFEEAPELSKLFPVVAKLYDFALLPHGQGKAAIINAILTSQPAYMDTAVYYDGSRFVDGTPKYPGFIGKPDNPGIPINWTKWGYTESNTTNSFLTQGEKPQTDIGFYQFNNVKQGTYILTLSRNGYVTRFAKIQVGESDVLLGHRELILGDLNGDLKVNEEDIAILRSKMTQPYNSFYDLDGNLKISVADISLQNFYLYFFYELYKDTKECFNEE